MQIMLGLAKEGKSILFITHKLNEIKQVADRCTVLRKGTYAGTVAVADTSVQTLADMMIGHKVNFSLDKSEARTGRPLLEVEGLSVKGSGHKKAVQNVSFTVHAGEIVCIAGIDGNGQSELVYALTGLMNAESGRIHLDGQDLSKASIRQRNEAGLSHIPEDRHKHGLVLDYSLEQNLVLKKYRTKEFKRCGMIRFPQVRHQADQLIRRFDIRSAQGAQTRLRSMSGGNQQKAIIAREIDTAPKVLIAVQPTRGLDVGAMLYIHEQLLKARDEGKGVLLVSLELDEVFQLADRILVIYEGQIVAELSAKETTAKEMGLYMAGSRKGAAHEQAK